MIALLEAMPVGNAVRCILQPPEGAHAYKVLRKLVPTFSGHDDEEAVVIKARKAFIDSASLPNQVQHFYRPYYLVGGAWVAGAVVSVTPAMTTEAAGPDALEVVRDRLEWGLGAEVQAGRLKHVDGGIPVLSAPPVFEETQFPIVTVHLTNQSRFASGIGEMVADDVYDAEADEWIEGEGVLWRVQLAVVAWVTNNPDTRIGLRNAVTKLLLANLPVFADAGLSEVEFSAVDTEDFESYGAPVYQTIFTFTCVTSQEVLARSAPISDVSVTAQAV